MDTAPTSEDRPRSVNVDGETPRGIQRPPREVRLLDHPRSIIGTTQCTGPYSRVRIDEWRRQTEAADAWRLIFARHMTVRQAADALGLSPTTAWRRAWWWHDYTLHSIYGLPPGPPPQQRGTRAVPRGRPVLPHDTDAVIRQLLAAGYTLADIAASWRTVAGFIRAEAYRRLIYERADDDTRAWLDAERDRLAVEQAEARGWL